MFVVSSALLVPALFIVLPHFRMRDVYSGLSGNIPEGRALAPCPNPTKSDAPIVRHLQAVPTISTHIFSL